MNTGSVEVYKVSGILEIVNALKKEVEVYFDKYYDHHGIVIATEKDCALIDICVSKKEATVPPSQRAWFEHVASKYFEVLQRRVPSGKRLSARILFLVGNYSIKNCKGEVNGIDAKYTIKIDDKGAWLFTIIKILKKWITARYKKLSAYCREKGEKDNKLLRSLEKIHGALLNAERRLKSLFDMNPAEASIVSTVAGLLRSLGVDPRPDTVLPVARLLAAAIGDTKSFSNLNLEKVYETLRKTCVEVKKKVFSPVRKIVDSFTQLISRNTEVKSIKIVRDEDFRGRGQSLTVYVLHWFTKRRVVVNSWSKIRGIIHAIAEVLGVRVDEGFLDRLESTNKVPAILLTPDAAYSAWKSVYRR